MQPTQHRITSKIRGFVCAPCLSQLRTSQNRPSAWQFRRIASDNNIARASQKRSNLQPLSENNESTVRYFEEDKDGNREEVLREDEGELVSETLAALERLEKQTGISSQTLLETLEGNPNLKIPENAFDKIVDAKSKSGALELIEKQNRLLLEQLEKFKNKTDGDGTSAEELLTLLKPISFKQKLAEAERPPTEETQEFLESAKPSEDRMAFRHDQRSSKPTQSPGEFIPLSSIPSDYRSKVQATLKSLEQALGVAVPRKMNRVDVRRGSPVAKLWVNYLSCRPGLLAVGPKVPARFWNSLWKVFESKSIHNLDRLVHLKCVGDDMLQAGQRLDFEQRLLHIEATFMNGGQIQAVNDWDLAGHARWTDTNQYREYMSQGVRMFCATGQRDRARLTAEQLLSTSAKAEDFRVLIPVIRAYLLSNEQPMVDQAWELYVKLRSGLEGTIRMEDYDAVSSAFLGANEANLALQIFTDMMFTGDESTKVYVSQHQSDQNVARVGPRYSLIKPDGSSVNIEASTSLARLPSNFNNKHFFGSWTKKLIGAGELDAVERIFALMQDRGMCPSSIHMNGLIGAWLREGTEANRIKAENLAWKMIKTRLEFVTERDLDNFTFPLRSVKSYGRMGNHRPNQTPLATMETFTILLQNYRRRRKYHEFMGLFDAVTRSKLPVDTRFINELLWIDSKAANNRDWVWQTYKSLMSSNATSPDFVTYTILWQNMKKQEDPVTGKRIRGSPDQFTTCRLLFKDMVDRTQTLKIKQPMPEDLYDLVILCFCYAKDIPGTAIALRALQQEFHLYPNVKTAQAVIGALARSEIFTQTDESRRQPVHVSARQRIANVTRIFGSLKDQRNESLKERGLSPDELDADIKEEEGLNLLLDLLQLAYRTQSIMRMSSDSEWKHATMHAAKEMGHISV